MALVEKENELGQHQTGHNSGVIHAGIYYKPGSLKARLCVEGAQLAYEYLDSKSIPYKRCGKLIVACDAVEAGRLDELYDRSLQNKVPGVQLLTSQKEISKIEPNCVGLKYVALINIQMFLKNPKFRAIWSPNTGIVDWGLVNRSYGDDFQSKGGTILTSFQVTKFDNLDQSKQATDKYPIRITSKDGRQLQAKYVIAAAGLQADKVAGLTNGKKIPKIVPFRGEYLVLKPSSSNIVKTNIYPVPDPRFPFLGVHFTPRMDGSIWVGPNAVLAFQREGYGYKDINFSELFETISFKGFRKLGKLTIRLDCL